MVIYNGKVKKAIKQTNRQSNLERSSHIKATNFLSIESYISKQTNNIPIENIEEFGKVFAMLSDKNFVFFLVIKKSKILSYFNFWI